MRDWIKNRNRYRERKKNSRNEKNEKNKIKIIRKWMKFNSLKISAAAKAALYNNFSELCTSAEVVFWSLFIIKFSFCTRELSEIYSSDCLDFWNNCEISEDSDLMSSIYHYWSAEKYVIKDDSIHW